MASAHLHIITDGLTGSASLDTAISRVILQRVSDGEMPESLQIGQPHRVVAFGRHDALTDGFGDAVEIANAHGFDPTIRIAGGRAVAFHPHVVRFAWTVPSADPVKDMHDRFISVTEHVIRALAALGVRAIMGELEREYCPGKYSVYLDEGGKIMGSGQRLARSAAQVAGIVVVRDASLVNEVLMPIYATLGLDMDPTKTAAVTDAADVEPGAVAAAMVQQFSGGRETLQSVLDDTTMALARRYQPEHDPRALA